MAEGPTQITITSCNGERSYINPGGTTVRQLKEKIEQEEGILVDEQCLVANGNRHLDDDNLSLLQVEEVIVQVDVYTMVRGSQRLTEFIRARGEELSEDFISRFTSAEKCKVLTPLGARLLRGIMSCVLKAHEEELAYGRDFSDEDMRVIYTVPIPSSASVCMEGIRPTEQLSRAHQSTDYQNVAQIIHTVFQTAGGAFPLHVGKIHTALMNLSVEQNNVDPSTCTQLMQALVAMVDPLIMATMWWNLGRFQSTFGRWQDQNRKRLDSIVSLAVTPQCWTQRAQRSGGHFRSVYRSRKNTRPYQDNGAELARFARNWFTHEGEDPSTEARDILDFDYYFSYYFGEFMADVLLVLYPQIAAPLASVNELTKVLVPPSL